MIFVTVGSRQYPFDRLFKKLDELCEKKIIKEKIFAQIGTSSYKPKYYEYKDFISPEEFDECVNKADIIITHGASGSIMKSLNANKKVIVVTRLEKYGEHINDHQIEICEELEKEGYILYYRDGETSLDELIREIKHKEFAKYNSDSNYIDILRKNI